VHLQKAVAQGKGGSNDTVFRCRNLIRVFRGIVGPQAGTNFMGFEPEGLVLPAQSKGLGTMENQMRA
jgi:hypothetical protein